MFIEAHLIGGFGLISGRCNVELGVVEVEDERRGGMGRWRSVGDGLGEETFGGEQ